LVAHKNSSTEKYQSANLICWAGLQFSLVWLLKSKYNYWLLFFWPKII